MNRVERLTACRLYGIVDLGYIPEDQLIPVSKKLLAGGLGILQLRAKNHAPEHIEQLGRQLAPLCREYGCLFIINDYPEVARSIGADGVHLGQEDGKLEAARSLLGPDALIGRSTHSPEQALGGFPGGADYIGFGPCFPQAPSREGRRSAWSTLRACRRSFRRISPSSASAASIRPPFPPFWMPGRQGP